jgi:glutamyl/glutaminyl-tRNA synthetase
MSNASGFHRTRLAPTPSGFLHAGNILSFVLTAGLARRHGAAIMLRIDDLDIGRVREAYVRDIFDTLTFLGIPWDEGPRTAVEFHIDWSQRLRLNRYSAYLLELMQRGRLFACDCTRTRLSGGDMCACSDRGLDPMAPGVAWRILTDTGNRICLKTLDDRVCWTELPSSVRYPILRKRDGDPAYHVASVVDDMLFGVDLIVRGADLLDSTLLQHEVAVNTSLKDFTHITFWHHPIISDQSGRKLSKSAGDGAVSDLRRQGAGRREVFGGICSSFNISEQPDTWTDLFDILSDVVGINANE